MPAFATAVRLNEGRYDITGLFGANPTDWRNCPSDEVPVF